jgi:hypothetical protein
MKRWLTTVLAFACFSAIVRADVTVVQTTTVEGGMAAMAGSGVNSTITTRVKGLKSRTDIEGGPISVSAIADVLTKQVIILNAAQKTATITTPATAPATPPAAVAATAEALAGAIDSTLTPTGRSQVIDGVKCNEYKLTTSIDLSAMAPGGQMPPEAAAMMQGVKMIMAGSIWVAKEVPGAAEYFAFQKAVTAADMGSLMGRASGMKMPGMDKMTKAMSGLDGLSYLTEIVMNVEGSGQMADMMKQMGAMKITTRTTSIKTEALGDDLFKVPEGYTIVKQ